MTRRSFILAGVVTTATLVTLTVPVSSPMEPVTTLNVEPGK